MTSRDRVRELALEDEGLEMTPMIDVTFLLLVFFLCTLRFQTLEGKLSAYLPKDVGEQQNSEELVLPVSIEVEVLEAGERVAPDGSGAAWSGTGRFLFRPGTRLLRYRVGPRTYLSLDGLLARLEKLAAEGPRGAPRLVAGRGTVYGDVVPVLDAARLAGLRELTLAGAR